MLTGTVPFKGTNPTRVYMDIKNRNIQWPEKKCMTDQAQHLINQMIQLEPENRLGHNFENLQVLKTHPFFKGIDFLKVSKHDYKELRLKVMNLMPKMGNNLGQSNNEESKLGQ